MFPRCRHSPGAVHGHKHRSDGSIIVVQSCRWPSGMPGEPLLRTSPRRSRPRPPAPESGLRCTAQILGVDVARPRRRPRGRCRHTCLSNAETRSSLQHKIRSGVLESQWPHGGCERKDGRGVPAVAAPSPMIQSQAVTCQSGGTGVYVNWPAWFGELTELRIGMAAMARSPPPRNPRISERRSRTDQRASLPGLAAVAGREPVLRVAAVAASAVGLAQSAQLGVSSRKSRTVRSWRDTAGRRVLGVCGCLVWGGGYAVVIGLRVGDAVGAGRTTNTSPGPRVRVIE